jgi:5-amino-6-(5-phosphoribosylamino)uracil reductase
MSIDGYLDSATTKRLALSNDADFDRVDAVRAACDAILVGAATVRNRRARLDSCANFFATGDAEKLVYCASDIVSEARDRLGAVATVVDGGEPVDMCRISEDLFDRGVHRLMVEGGGTVHTQFLTADLADELHLVVAPFFVGDSRAPRFVSDGRFPWNPDRRATLAEVRQIGDVVLLRYALSSRFCAD